MGVRIQNLKISAEKIKSNHKNKKKSKKKQRNCWKKFIRSEIYHFNISLHS